MTIYGSIKKSIDAHSDAIGATYAVAAHRDRNVRGVDRDLVFVAAAMVDHPGNGPLADAATELCRVGDGRAGTSEQRDCVRREWNDVAGAGSRSAQRFARSAH